MKRKFLYISLITVFICNILFIGCGAKKNAQKKDKEKEYVPVETKAVKKGTIFNSTIISGKVVSDKEVMIVPKVPGRVENVNVKVGDEVSVGSTLFSLEKKDIQRSIETAKAALDSAKSSIDTAKAAYNTAKANYNVNYEKIQNAKVNFQRTQELYKQGIVSKADYEKAELAASDSSIEALKAQLQQAEAGYKQAQSGSKQAEVGYQKALDALNDATITSPIKGVVSSVNIEKGEMASNAQPSITIVSVDKVYIQVNVSENLISKIHKGDKVDVEIPSTKKQKFTGKINTISPSVDPKTQLYSIKVEIENSKNEIKPGMFGKVNFKTDAKKNVIMVNSEAVIKKEGKYVVYISKNGKAIEAKVELGLDNGEFVEIKKGITLGNKIIVKGQDYVENGTVVKDVRGDK